MQLDARHLAALRFLRLDSYRDAREAPGPADAAAFVDLCAQQLATRYDHDGRPMHRLTHDGAAKVAELIAAQAA